MLAMRLLLVHTIGTQGLPVQLAVQGQDGVVEEATLGRPAVLHGFDVLNWELDCLVEGCVKGEDFLGLGRYGQGGEGMLFGWFEVLGGF